MAKNRLNVVTMKIADLKAYENNPRKNEKAVDAVANSINSFGFKVPVIIDKNNVVVAGHTRLRACKKLGIDEVSCVIADDLTEDQIKAFRIADNKTAELADWDFDKLKEELGSIEIDMEQFGFTDLEKIMDREVMEDEFDENEALPENPYAMKGDVFILGKHRVMCGDATSKDDVLKLVDGKIADMIFTDPPYGMKKESDGVANDNLNHDDLLEFNRQWIPLTFDALKDNGSWYCWGIDEPLMDIYSEILKPMIKQNKITFRNLITWDKGYGQGQNSEAFRMYPIADEKCLFIQVGIQALTLNADQYWEEYEPIRKYLNEEMEKCGGAKNWRKALSNQMGKHYFTKSQWYFPTEENYKKLQAFGKEYGAFGKEYDELRKEYDELRAYFNNTHDNMNNVWHFDRTGNEERELTGGHATPKPIALCSRAIKSSSREGEIVLDVFGGSGSTLIACELVKRKALLMELEPMWCDVIVKRYLRFVQGYENSYLLRNGEKISLKDIADYHIEDEEKML